MDDTKEHQCEPDADLPPLADAALSPAPPVFYCYNAQCASLADLALSSVCPRRSALVHSLVAACGLFERGLSLRRFSPASLTELEEYHSAEYLSLLAAPGRASEEELVDAGLSHDCPVFDGLLSYARHVAGGALAAADLVFPPKAARQRKRPLRDDAAAAPVAVFWDGGRHHARRGAASGFCYANDAVLCVQRLRASGARRVLFLDVDVHCPDAVASAFERTSSVCVVSMHRSGPGIFPPGVGLFSQRGDGDGAGHTLNLPCGDGLSDDLFFEAFRFLVSRVASIYRPDAVVLLAGADGLAGDPLGGWALTPAALVGAALATAALGVPMVLLGGGGYVPANAARAWAAVTSALVDARAGGGGRADELPRWEWEPGANVPEHANLLSYGPDFTFWPHVPAPPQADDRGELMRRCAELVAALQAEYEE